jgi:glyoxylate utilization-related uncharacterized protein
VNTTLFINNQNRHSSRSEQCHGGIGPFDLLDVIRPAEKKLFIKFIHDDIVPPGSTFGIHDHKSETPFEEWYYCLSGHGIMHLDGKDYEMNPGDISVCYANGSHGIRNTGNENMRILVICASHEP